MQNKPMFFAPGAKRTPDGQPPTDDGDASKRQRVDDTAEASEAPMNIDTLPPVVNDDTQPEESQRS